MAVSIPAPATSPALTSVYRTELSPLSFLRRSSFVHPDKIAVVHAGRRYTYRELDERVNRFASALVDAGIERGDRVAVLCPNIPPLLEAHFAVPAAGAVLVAINTRLSAGEVHYILEHSRAHRRLRPRADRARRGLRRRGRARGGHGRARRPVRGLPRRRLA